VTEFPTIEGLNRDHVHNRLRELELPLTARAPVESPAREIARLQERVVRLEDGLKALQELTTELQGKLARTESTLAAHRLAIQGAGKWTTAPGHIEPTIQPAKFSA
jgi:Ni,Fe-hydrogenase I large subunit